MRENNEIEARLQKLIIPPSLPLSEAMEIMGRTSCGVLLVCDAERHLEGLLTDSDIRKAVLRGEPTSTACSLAANRAYHTALHPVAQSQALNMMDDSEFFANHIPVLDENERVIDFILRSDLVPAEESPMTGVVMAGGQGIRLRPLTDRMPKPMLPIGTKPLLEIIIQQLRLAGIKQVDVTTHYMCEKIIDYFGDGQHYGMDIRYVNEETPLGTAGGLSLIEGPTKPMLVINGDILTQVDLNAMLSYHRQHAAALTIGVRIYTFQVPYGRIECNGPDVLGIREKPVYSCFVNAGVYILEPSAHQMIPAGQRMDMTDLVDLLLQQGKRVVSFPILEYWQDIGQYTDYERVQQDVMTGRVKL